MTKSITIIDAEYTDVEIPDRFNKLRAFRTSAGSYMTRTQADKLQRERNGRVGGTNWMRDQGFVWRSARSEEVARRNMRKIYTFVFAVLFVCMAGGVTLAYIVRVAR